MSLSANARHVRWEQLMAENKGKIDMAAAQRFLADHYHTYSKKKELDEHALGGRGARLRDGLQSAKASAATSEVWLGARFPPGYERVSVD